MQPIPNSWSTPPDGGNHDLTRLEAKVNDLLSALEAPAASAYSEQPPAGLLAYLRTLKRHALLMAAIAILLATAGWYIGQRQQKVYQARTTVELLEPGRTLTVRNLASNHPMFGGDTYIETQVTKLRSATLLRAVQQRLHPGQTPGEQDILAIRRNLGVSPVRGTSLIQVTYDAPDPGEAANFLNDLSGEFIRSDMEDRAWSAEQTRTWLTKELEDSKAKLENSELRLQAYANSSGLLYTSPKGNVAEQAEDKLQFIARELAESQAKRANLQAKYEVALARSTDTPVGPAQNDSLYAVQSRLLDLKKQQASLVVQFTPEYYRVRQVNAEINELQASLAKEYVRWLAQLKQEFETEQRHENLIETAYRQQALLVSDQASKAINYNVLKREVETNRNLYDSLLGGMKEAGVNAAARVRNARVVDAAMPPAMPYRPSPARNAAIGLLAGLMIGVVIVVMNESTDQRVKAPGTAPSYLNVPELGVIPSVKPRFLPTARRELIVNGHSRRVRARGVPAKVGPVADAFHSTVTSIFFSGRDLPLPKTLVVTSAAAHEGKSTIVGNLGLMAAQMGKRVLLIDGDLRNPRLHQIYSLSNERGLTDILLQQESLEDGDALRAVQATNVERLWLLPSGQSSNHLLPLLHSERMSEALTQFRDEFDLILIDTPPVLPFADARVFGRLSDAVILVVRSGHTSRNTAVAAKARFADDGLPLIGTILNDWNAKKSGYEYSETAYRY